MEKTENGVFTDVLTALSIAEKKARIYARLLTDVTLAKEMEQLACRYEKQKTALQALSGGKKPHSKTAGGDA